MGISTLTITLTNPNSTALTGLAFTDTYPAGGMGNVLHPGTTNSCGGTVTGGSLGGSLSLTGGTLAANSSCTVTTTVASGTPGVLITSPAGDLDQWRHGHDGFGDVHCQRRPYITKSFTPTRINTGETSTLTLTLTNVLALLQNNVSFTTRSPPASWSPRRLR